jgi:hypothetical protein
MRLTIVLGLRFLKRAGGASNFSANFGISGRGVPQIRRGEIAPPPARIVRAIKIDRVPDASPIGETALSSVVTRSIQELWWWPFPFPDPYTVSRS